MSFFGYNYYKKLNRPLVYLAFPNKQIIGTLQSKELQTDFFANSMIKGSFKVNRYENGKSTPYYHLIEIGSYIYLHNIDWFIIKEINIINKGVNEYKEVTYISLEHELSKKYLTSFGSLGIETDEQGGLDRYCLYNPSDIKHSILHIVMEKSPDWSIKYIDPSISTEYRNFQVDSIDIYTFLTQNVAQSYDCVFLFDSTDKTISAYLLENLGKDTNIILSYRNFIKSIEQKSSDDEVKTVLTVVGGNDSRTNTPLNIIDVNVAGTNQICNFSYYYHMMSDELKNGLQRYTTKCQQNIIEYQNQLAKLNQLYLDLNNLNSKAPNTPNSTNWTEYGLTQLQTQEKIYKNNMSLYTKQEDSILFKQNSEIHTAIEKEIRVRENQINNKKKEVDSCKLKAQELTVKLYDFLGDRLYSELSVYVKEDTLTDDSFIVTTTMTDSEVLNMQKELLNHATKELEKICQPKFETKIDLINFTVNYDYKKFTDQMDLFNIIHIRFEEHDSVIDARLLKLHINWDDPSDFNASFSNRNSLDETFSLLKEIQDQAQSTATHVGFSSGAWKNGSQQSSKLFSDYQNGVFDASLKQIQSSKNQECIFDETGVMLREWIPSKNDYDPCQMWLVNNQLAMTIDGWKSVSLALGYIKVGNQYFYGLNATHLLGKITLTEQLYVSNESGNYSVNKDGLTAKNDIYQVKINPNTPSDIFSISVDNKKLLYIDVNNKKLKFEGDIEATSGHIANYVISTNTLTSGKIGMSSDSTSGAKSFWAGDSNPNNAPFWVNNLGKLHASNIEITGGELNINNNFLVNSKGELTAKSGTFSGKVTGGSINIGNGKFVVDENGSMSSQGGSITSGTITGGSININNKFLVNSNGDMIATSGRIGGTSENNRGWKITASGIEGLNSSTHIKGGNIITPSLMIEPGGATTKDNVIFSAVYNNNAGDSEIIARTDIQLENDADIICNTKEWTSSPWDNKLNVILDSIWTGYSWSLEELEKQVKALWGAVGSGGGGCSSKSNCNCDNYDTCPGDGGSSCECDGDNGCFCDGNSGCGCDGEVTCSCDTQSSCSCNGDGCKTWGPGWA